MAQTSPIEWTDLTWNPLRGCTRVSPGCGGPGPHGGCYAEKIAARFSDPEQAYHGLAIRTPSGGRWTGEVALAEHLLDAPLRWRKPRRVFVNSMSDIFHEAVPDEWIDRIFAVMALAPQHSFQVLTKRADRMRAYLTRPGVEVRIGLEALGVALKSAAGQGPKDVGAGVRIKGSDINPGALEVWPLPNVWLGVSVENQKYAEERIHLLAETPAAVRFLSCEPLLGSVDLFEALSLPPIMQPPLVDWVIVGGESGPRARPMQAEWARSVRDQCAAADVPFFFKQWGEYAPTSDCNGPYMMHVGKKQAGRLLDGVEHSAFPQVLA